MNMSKIEKKVVVANKKGMHARPAAFLVQLAEKFNVTLTIVKGDEKVNGKSIMGILMLGAQYNTPLTLEVDGDEAVQAMAAFEDFFSKQEEEFIQ